MRLASRRLSMGIIAIKEGAQRQPREALSLARRAFTHSADYAAASAADGARQRTAHKLFALC